MKKIIVMLLALVALCGCQTEEFEGFDMPFVKVTTTTGASQTVVLSNVNNINTYVVSVSSKMLTTALVVNYEIVVGDGLQEGVDYELVTTGNQLTFEPGIYDMPIRIKWLAHPVDETKDNTLTIRLTGNSQNLQLGVPGPDGLQKQLVIEKKN